MKKLTERNEIIKSLYRDGTEVEAIAQEFNIIPSRVYAICKGELRNRKRLKPGCDDCPKNPYAKGLCHKCYMRQWRINNLKKLETCT